MTDGRMKAGEITGGKRRMDKRNDRFPSSSEEKTYFTPYKDPSEFTGNIQIKSMKQLTAKIRSDIKEFIDILKEIHEKSRKRRRTGAGCALAGLGALVIAATGGLAAPAVVSAGVAVGGAVIISVSAAIEQIDTKKNIKAVEKRWEQFVHEFLANYVYYCDSEDTARMILTHVKHVVYQEEDSYEFFRLLLGNRNPLVPKYYSSDRLYGYLEDASHIDQDYRGTKEFNTSYSHRLYGYLENATRKYKSYRVDDKFEISSFILFKILDLIKLSLTLDHNSESAASQPLRNLTNFLDIIIVVVDSLPNYCECSRYKVKHPLTYEDLIQMFDTAIRLAEMCNSEARAAEMYRRKKNEAELQMYEDEILNLYDNMIAVHETYESEIIKMYKVRIAEKLMISTRYLGAEELEYDKHPCPLCKAFNCRCIEVCARCHRPLK